MRSRRSFGRLAAAVLTGAIVLPGCTDSGPGEGRAPAGPDASEASDGGGHEGMEHPMDGGPAPEGITPAEDPEYPVGTEVTLTADHMEGMEGTTATIAGVFDTTTYSVSYTPTDGGEPVTDHRWDVHEELENPGEAPLAEGTEVVIDAAHMEGMQGAEATIDSATEETVYIAGRASSVGFFDLLGYDLHDYEELSEEKFDLLLKLNREEVANWSGRFRAELRDVEILPRPTSGSLPVWRAVGGVPGSSSTPAKDGATAAPSPASTRAAARPTSCSRRSLSTARRAPRCCARSRSWPPASRSRAWPEGLAARSPGPSVSSAPRNGLSPRAQRASARRTISSIQTGANGEVQFGGVG